MSVIQYVMDPGTYVLELQHLRTSLLLNTDATCTIKQYSLVSARDSSLEKYHCYFFEPLICATAKILS